jgi:hypothetical protein
VESRKQAETRLRENILQAQVEAALSGHDLGPFEPVEEPGLMKHQAICRSCGRSVYVSTVALYSLLEDECPGNREPEAN